MISDKFSILKPFSACRDDLFKYPQWYFGEKEFKIFFLGWESKIHFLKLMMWNHLKIWFLAFFSSRKCLIWGVLTNFSKNIPFWDPTYLQNIFHTYNWIFLAKALHLSTQVTIFWVIIFWPKKRRNCSKLKSFVKIV